MSRINTPATLADAPKESLGMLEQVEKSLGSIPNLFRLISNSPATLEA